MGLPKQVAKIILAEHVHRPITGRVLMMGRQFVSASEAEVRAYMQELNIPGRSVTVEYDKLTHHSPDLNTITDQSFFSLFTDAKFSALDLTDYEGADILHDMNEPIPEALKGKFDFIYDGGCMDNMFNPVQFIANCTALLAPGGRIVHLEFGSLWRGAYLMYSGDWFNDYYALNQFADCKVYYAKFCRDPWNERWTLSQLRPFRGRGTNRLRGKTWVNSPWPHMILVVAERHADSTGDKMPVQMNYRPQDHNWPIYEASCRRFVETVRYPRGFGNPTEHSSNGYGIVDHLRSRLWRTRSNLQYCQIL